MSTVLIPTPLQFQSALPTIQGNVDYQQFRERLLRIDELLGQSGVEDEFVRNCTQRWLARSRSLRVSTKAQVNYQTHTRRALRCNIARTLLDEGFREFSTRLADSPLLQHFCELSQFTGAVRVPSKSTLQRYSVWCDVEVVNESMASLLRQAHEKPAQLKLTKPLDMESLFVDTTALKANIHYPVDWVLLRDATRSLMKTVQVIRNHGLLHRMEEPQAFISRMNRLCIEMTHAGKKADSKRARKRILRAMDKLVDHVARHARHYRKMLDEDCQKTDWTRTQADFVLRRLDQILDQLPEARKQARERILQNKIRENKDKILSLYEPDVHVIVRGKAGAEVEFGNTLLLGENLQGLILDWKLFKDVAPGDPRLLTDSIDRTEERLECQIKEVVTDRGFDSEENRDTLRRRKVYNNVCPKDPRSLESRCNSPKFRRGQKRRSQTEARVGILKNNFFGTAFRSEGFERRELAVGWAVLTHNLWVIARLPKRKPRKKPALAPLLQAA